MVERKLAAILAADVAGYSRLVGADEEGTVARLRSLRRELVDPKIKEHHGRIVKTTGDGMLIEFASAVDAVRCAAEIQRAMVDRNASVLVERRITFRAGINVGDIIVEGDDILRDGVNVAARLEALAQPGGICISGAVYDYIRDKLPLPFADQGEQSVKNIARPVRVYALTAEAVAALPETPTSGDAPSPPGRRWGSIRRVGQVHAAAVAVFLVAGVVFFAVKPMKTPQPFATAPRLSIVVLPFANLSGDPLQDYLADVITEELTSSLSRIRGTFVIARSTPSHTRANPRM